MPPSGTATAAEPAPRPESLASVPIAELVAMIGGSPSSVAPDARVSGVTLRSQDVRAGDLFAALPGAKAHGADFAERALAGGAGAILTDAVGASRPAIASAEIPVLVADDPRMVLGALSARVYGDPTARLAVLGVTGTSGKTTVSFFVDAGLRAAGLTTGLLGTVRTMIAGRRWDAALTTPEAPDLQALFAIMLERGVSHAVMEVSSHALALHRVDGTRFAVGAFTNLSRDHLDFHPTMEDYFAAKALLFDGRAINEVINIDDEWAPGLRHDRTVTVSSAGAPGAGWHAESIVPATGGGQRFVAVDPSGLRTPVRMPLPGAYNVANALLALACLDQVGVPASIAATGLADVSVPGRLERVDAGQPHLALVDYAHKPGAVAALLGTLRESVPQGGRLLVVLGCGGDRDTEKRPLMGAEAARRAELLVITDDNPRSEDPAAIRAAMRAGALTAPPLGEVLEIGDRAEAIEAAVSLATERDVLVIAGKGHETGQEIRGTRRPFSDVEALRSALVARWGDDR